MTSPRLLQVIACRSEVDYLLAPTRPAHRGHNCAACGVAVVATEDGEARIRRGEIDATLCNSCAFEYAKLVQQRGKLAGVVMGTAAAEQVASGNRSRIAEWLRNYAAAGEKGD
jgi:hypothetical protein